MKKALIILVAVVTLSGCGTNEMTTCTNETKVGNITSKTVYTVEHKDNDVKKIMITYEYNDNHTDGVGTGTDGTTKDKIADEEDNPKETNENKTKTDNDGLIGGATKEALDDIVTGITDGILDIAGIKESHNTRFDTYTSVEGFTRNVDVDNANDYKVTYTYDLTKLSDADITALGVNKDYNALKKSYTDRGLTCK